MRIIIGMPHPKQVHFWKNIINNLEKDGHEVKIVAWEKDIALYLLNAYGFEYEIIGKNYKGLIKKAYGMLESDLKLLATDLELTGAQIKFAVLAAFFVAKKDRKKIAMSHLLQGVDRELMKEGRALSGRERERFFKHGSCL